MGVAAKLKAAKAAQVNVHYAKTHLSKLLARAARGEEITIARFNRPIARLVPLPEPRRPGSARGLIRMAADFDAPLRDFEAAFYGSREPKP